MFRSHGLTNPGQVTVKVGGGTSTRDLGETVVPWRSLDIGVLHRELEVRNWAPWLQASALSLQERSNGFPAEQLAVVLPGGKVVASLSLARIMWSGDPATLPHWDQIALDPNTDLSSFRNNYCTSSGNTLVAMSMNVSPDFVGKGLAGVLLRSAQALAVATGTEHLIGSFRPNGFGPAKTRCIVESKPLPTFLEYCNTIVEGSPQDGWLRSLSRFGMVAICEDTLAMQVTVPADEFLVYKAAYKPERWHRTGHSGAGEVWECGEVGVWVVNYETRRASYEESNLWGRLPIPSKC